MEKKYKYILLIMAMGLVFMGGNLYAQISEEEYSEYNSGKLSVDRPSFVPYKAAWRVIGRDAETAIFGYYDSVTEKTTLTWVAMTVYDFYLGLEVGPSFDLGQGVNKFGGTARATIGYSAEKIDLSVSFGVTMLANPYNGGKRYPAMDGVFEARYNIARWPKEIDRHRFYLCAIAGFAEHLTYSEAIYDDPEIEFRYSGRHSSVTLGAGMGYEYRPHFSPMRWGVKLSFRTYQTQFSSKIIVNDEVRKDVTEAHWRFVPMLTFTMKGVFARTAQHTVEY